MQNIKIDKTQSVEQKSESFINETKENLDCVSKIVEHDNVEKGGDILKLESELLTLGNNEEELIGYIEKLRKAGSHEKFPIFHGTRGGYNNIVTILKSEERGVKGGEIGGSPSYALYPVGVYWANKESAGFKYSFERKQMQLPGEAETLDTVIKIDEKGIAYLKEKLGHLSLIEFDGEVVLGPYSEASQEVIKNIKQELSHIWTMKREIKPAIQVINEFLKTVLNIPVERSADDKYLREKLFSLFPMTFEQYKNKTYEQRLQAVSRYAQEYLEKEKQSSERYQKRIDLYNTEKEDINNIAHKINSRSNILWRSKFLTLKFIEKQAAGQIKEGLLSVMSEQGNSSEYAKNIKSWLASFKDGNDFRRNYENSKIERCQKNIACLTSAINAIVEIEEKLLFFNNMLTQKIIEFQDKGI